MALTPFEQYIATELTRKYSLPPEENNIDLPEGFAVRTRGVGNQLELVPFPSAGIFGDWDMAADSNIPPGGGPGALYEITGADATRDGEDFSDGDIAIILSDGATARNLTTWMSAGDLGGDPLTGWASYADGTHTIGLPFNVATGDGDKTLTNDAATTVNTYLPSDSTNLYDGVNFQGTVVGEAYVFTIQCKADPANNNTSITFKLNDGVTDLFSRSSSLGTTGEKDVTFSTHFVATADFIANGGTLTVATDTTNVNIYDITYEITRTYSPNGVTAGAGTPNIIVGDWDISAAADESIPAGAQEGYIYRVTPGTYPHVHTSGGGAFVESYQENDLAIVVDTVTPIVRNLTLAITVVGLTQTIQGTWDMDTLAGSLPGGANQYDFYEVEGVDYTLGGQLYKAGDIAVVMDTVGPIVQNITRGILDDAATADTHTWSSLRIVDYIENTLINDGVSSGANVTWSVDQIVAQLALKSTIDDMNVASGTTWSSDKINTTITDHTTDATVHFVIDDLATTTTNVWSGNKLDTMFSSITSIINDLAGDTDTTETWSAHKLYNTLEVPLTTHVADATKHREINDAGSANTDLWSAEQIALHVTTNAGAQIDDLAGDTDTTVTWSADKLYNDIELGHVGDPTVHRTINDGGTANTDLWSGEYIDQQLALVAGVAIDDLAGDGDTTVTWSADKSYDTIYAHTSDANLHRTINDSGSANTDLWSAQQITNYVVGQLTGSVTINDMVTSTTQTWSSFKIDEFVTAAIAAVDHTPIIDDLTTGTDTTWSSSKIDTEISDAVTGIDHTVLIDDGAPDANKAWSSFKINAEIAAAAGGGGGLEPWVLLDNTPAGPLDTGRYFLDYLTNGMFDVELPENPDDGVELEFFHVAGDPEAEVTPPRIRRNTSTPANIDGVAADDDWDANFVSLTYVYVNAAIGWRTKS